MELVLLLLIGWNSTQPLCLIPIDRAGVKHKRTQVTDDKQDREEILTDI